MMRSPHTAAPSQHVLAPEAPRVRRGERGAVLVNVAIALVGLISFSALVIDYGVLWSARRQAQNAADAGAMAAAVSLAYVDYDNRALARTSALTTARANYIWGAVPDITDADVTFPPCPPGSPGAGSDACVRVDVFRNQRPGGNPLPTIFGRLIGITDQGVRATATAQVLWGDSADCVKPWAIPDKWEEHHNDQLPTIPGWDATDSFEHYDGSTGAVLPSPDIYRAATTSDAGTGFTSDSVGLNGADYGLQITLKQGNPGDAIAPGWYYPVIVDPTCTGGDCYREAIEGCSTHVWGPGDLISNEPGNKQGPTQQGVEALIAQDPGARWNDTTKAIENSCVESTPSCGSKSPRLVAIPVFDPDEYDSGKASGRQDIVITKILGFFIEGMAGTDVIGRLCFYPDVSRIRPGGSNIRASSFVISIALVR
jgi:putative Flp pilus-assembly TadE/G-like protein